LAKLVRDLAPRVVLVGVGERRHDFLMQRTKRVALERHALVRRTTVQRCLDGFPDHVPQNVR
jgi:hypothetical protein